MSLLPVIKPAFVVRGLLLLLATASVQAQPNDAVYSSCVACHGVNGEGNVALKAPALAGQLPGYLQRQLQNFKSGIRGAEAGDTLGMQMRGMASLLADDAAIAAVVAHIETLPPSQGVAVEFDKRNGENQYNAACGACHGGQAQGNAALNAPRLAGLDDTYLRRQYSNFGAGLRGSHAEDRYGRQMKMMSTMLRTDKDVDDVMGYIVSQ